MKLPNRLTPPARLCYWVNCLRAPSCFKPLVQFTLLCLATASSAGAAIHYVDPISTAPQAPYLSWGTAAVTIQQAIDSAAAGDEIVVTNGTYATGGRALAGNKTNRVAVDKQVTVRSVNGPQFTVIQGYQVPGTTNWGGAIRCVHLASGASLIGFSLTSGATVGEGGGGVWCESATAMLSNCVIVGNSVGASGGGASGGTLNNCMLSGNSAFYGGGADGSTLNNCTLINNSAHPAGVCCSALIDGGGGGATGSTLNNCLLSGNSATDGGGAESSTLNNCTLVGNSAITVPFWGGSGRPSLYGGSGGGATYCTLNNCIVYFNQAAQEPNYDLSSSLDYCCTTPQPANGAGNISTNPQLATAWRLSAASPCRGAGNAAYASGTDLDDETWASPPAIGCDEYRAGSVTGALTVGISVAYTTVAAMYPLSLTGFIDGRATLSAWDSGDGLHATNQPYVTHAWIAPGDYAVVLRAYNEDHLGGISSTVTVHVASQSAYVAADSLNPQPPYSSWQTAATVLQDAVDAAAPGAIVLVTNGLYATGGRVVAGLMTNRVAVDKPVTVRSVNGPKFTVIRGYQVPGTTNGDGAIRCVYLAGGASLSGFTLTNGATRSNGDYNQEQSGGGLCCEFPSGVVSNCLLIGNSAFSEGGGAFYGKLENCLLSGNSVTADYGSGGGASRSELYGCLLTTNTATAGGGADYSMLNNCALNGNAASDGGGAAACTMINCTLVSNSATNSGGGIANSSANNCIVYFNTAANGPNYDSDWSMNYCCTTPQPTSGFGNISNAPLLVNLAAGNLRLQSNSPCINAGHGAEVSGDTDLDGNPRIVGGAVDIGPTNSKVRLQSFPMRGSRITICPSTARRITSIPTATV